MSDSKPQDAKMATQPMASPPAPQEAPDDGLQSAKAAVLARRELILKDLRDGYPAAGAAEALLLRLASADAACQQQLQECNAILASVYASSLLREPNVAAAANRMARDLQFTIHALNSRVRQSLTTATTIMATARIAGTHEREGDK